MIRRLFIAAVSLAALTACTTYNSGYRNYSPAQAGYGDYYYAPDPGPSYYSPGYLNYPAYYSLYWGFDRRYYSAWRQPHFHYGVTWFPNDWFAFSVVHRYPRYSYWHPYAPYRYSAWDHRFAWHHYSPPPRYRYHHRQAPRYGHPSNERHMQREQLAAARPSPAGSSGPRARSAVQAAAAQRIGDAPQRVAHQQRSATTTPGHQTTPGSTAEARMRQQREARLRDEEVARARSMTAPAEARQMQRPWQQTQPAPRARTGVVADANPPRNIPERRDSQGPRQVMGDPRGAPMRQVTDGRTQDPRTQQDPRRMQDPRTQAPRIGDAPRARPAAPAPVQQQRMPVRQAPQAREEVRHAPRGPAPVAPQRHAIPTDPQPRMQPQAPAQAAPVRHQAPARQAVPARATQTPAPAREAAPPPRRTTTRSSGRARSSIEQEP